MKKYSIALLVVVAAMITVFFFWTARSARKKSDDIMSKFMEVDSSLNLSTDSAKGLKGLEAIQQVYPISILKSELILLIDSLKENYNNIPASSNINDVSKRMRPDIMRLLNDVQRANKIMQDRETSQAPDTIKYWQASGVISGKEWFSMYFENTSKEGIITYLNYLRNQTMSINSNSSY